MTVKERLEEIKTWLNRGFDLTEEDIELLIKQAERVQELENENRILRTVAESNKYIGEQYLEQSKRYREVIKKAIDDLENECLWDALMKLKALEGEE